MGGWVVCLLMGMGGLFIDEYGWFVIYIYIYNILLMGMGGLFIDGYGWFSWLLHYV